MGDEHSLVDLDKCMGCGLCASHCVHKAVSLKLAPEKGIPLDIGKLRLESSG